MFFCESSAATDTTSPTTNTEGAEIFPLRAASDIVDKVP